MTDKLHLEAVGGFCAGILGTVIGYPLDLVKTRMQTSITTETSMIHVGANVVRKEGFLSLYKGIGPPLMSLSILNTINFSSYSYFRNIYGAQKGWDVRNGLAGATGGTVASSISTVENLVKTQMQLDNIGLKRYRGSLHCVQSLVQLHGIKILFTGHFVNTAREVVFLSSYFFSYEGYRDVLLRQANIPPQVAIPISGGLSGGTAWFVSFPLDCIKAGIQGQPIKEGIVPKLRGFQVAKLLWKTKGLRGLYSGVTPTLIRAFLVSGCRFSAYEFTIWLIKDYN